VIFSRLAHGFTTPLLLGIYAPPITIAQDARIDASQGRLALTMSGRVRAHIAA
jgi:hypothetical protein